MNVLKKLQSKKSKNLSCEIAQKFLMITQKKIECQSLVKLNTFFDLISEDKDKITEVVDIEVFQET